MGRCSVCRGNRARGKFRKHSTSVYERRNIAVFLQTARCDVACAWEVVHTITEVVSLVRKSSKRRAVKESPSVSRTAILKFFSRQPRLSTKSFRLSVGRGIAFEAPLVLPRLCNRLYGDLRRRHKLELVSKKMRVQSVCCVLQELHLQRGGACPSCET